MVFSIFFEKSDDDEFVYQVLYIVYRLLFKDLITDEILANSRLMDYCIEALGDKNPRIRRLVNDIDDLIMEFDPVLAEKIKAIKFYIHNQEWGDSMEQFDENMDSNG